MRVAVRLDGTTAGELVLLAEDGLATVPLPAGLAQADQDLRTAIEHLGPLAQWPTPAGPEWTSAAGARFGVPVVPETIIGVGLNFLPHAADLKAVPTQLPTLFFKGRHTVIGPDDAIGLPAMSKRVTAEAELALVIGRRLHRVSAEDALGYVAGACCALDQTAEDILQQDSRMLTVSKNFAGFFSFGPEIISLDELTAGRAGGLADVTIETWLNGRCEHSAPVGDMRFGPAELLSFISQVMPLEPGDIVSTGTPGAVALRAGDVVECRISGMLPLANSVVPAGW